jgi:hypothetical protein
MIKLEVSNIIAERRKLHVNDPSVENYWDKLTDILIRDENTTIQFLDNSDSDTIMWISEVFEDVSEQLNSMEFIKCLEGLNNKYPKLNLESFVNGARNFLT